MQSDITVQMIADMSQKFEIFETFYDKYVVPEGCLVDMKFKEVKKDYNRLLSLKITETLDSDFLKLQDKIEFLEILQEAIILGKTIKEKPTTR